MVDSRAIRLLLSVSVGTLALGAAPAMAQTATIDDDAEQARTNVIVVTAQRRAEDVQDVPITVTAVTQDQLDIQNITTTTDLTRAVPALTATNFGVYQVRGIGTQGFGRSAEQSVSVVLDGVVLGRGLTNSLYDVENVEVLSGPQGTLFGKNSNAGVINVVTKAPKLNQYEAIGHVDIGNHDYIHGYAIANLPLGDEAAFRFSFHYDRTGHVVRNTMFNEWDDNRDVGGRVRFLVKPSDRLTVNLALDYQHLTSNGVNGAADFAGVAVFKQVPAGSLLEARLAACGIVAGNKNNRVCANSLRAAGVPIGDTYGRKNYGGSATIDYELSDDLTFTSITALRKTRKGEFGKDADIAGDFADTLPLNLLDRNLVPYVSRTFSEEARIASSTANPLSFVAGVYYSSGKTKDVIDQTGTFGINLGGLEFRRNPVFMIKQRDYAAFGQVDWRITPELKIFVGGRYTHNDLKDFSFNLFKNPNGRYIFTGNTGFFSVLPVNSCTLAGGIPYDAIQVPCPAGTSIAEAAHIKKSGFSGTAGAQYEVGEDTMVFARYSRGYKGPFLNESVTYTASLARQPLKIDPEYVDAFDVGIKTRLFGRFALNASAFYSKIDGFQTTIYVPPVPPQLATNFIQGNADYATTKGVEVSFYGNLTPNLSLSGGLLYNEARFNKGFQVPCTTSTTGVCPALSQLPYAPKWKATLASEYHRELGNRIEGFAQADFAYSDKYNYGSSPGNPTSPSRYLLGLRGGLRFGDGKFSFAGFCRNCLDKRYPVVTTFDGFASSDGARLPAVAGGPAPVGSSFVQFLSIDSYRVWGVTLDASF
ncbi:TonB-dependent receptor [Novosphingobium sp. Gsoil 351]|uniref:TonB-dependent receptor n=1 Tax=Novosphingobium sp. Gsoil 351 TaxID=2675225 RepID=UPI0012B4C339|nr:TonB-dependent receptor [Novosphingobium sp. Gsoil 351]QGN55676.1 TonB-dependent receptor [Novosphingobium sp. Gsoil 351]